VDATLLDFRTEADTGFPLVSVQVVHCIVETLLRIQPELRREGIVNVNWPPFFLKGQQNEFLAGSRLPESLYHLSPDAELTKNTVVVGRRGQSLTGAN
jgi:hypothetical protein